MPSLPLLGSNTDLSRGAVVTLGLRVLGAGLLYALHVVLARWMQATGYGHYVFAMSWASFLAQLGALGLPNAALRFISEYRTTQKTALLRGFLRTSRGLILAGAGVLVVGAGGIALVLPARSVHLPSLLVGLALTPLLSFLLFDTQVLRAFNRFAWSYAPNQILRPLLVGLGTGSAFWATGVVTPVQALLWTGLALLLTVLLQHGVIQLTLSGARASPTKKQIRHWIRTALPLLLITGSQLILGKTDIFLVGALAGGKEVGIYFAALRTAQVVTLLPFAVDAVAGPEVARLYHDQSASLQSTVSRFAHWYFWPTLGAAFVLIVLASPVLSLFGPEFTTGTPILIVLVIGFVFNAATGAQTHLLTLTGHEKSCSYVYGICAALNVALNLVGVLSLGALGAALATATSLTIRNLWIRRRVIDLTGVRPTILPRFSRSAPQKSE